MGKLKYNSDRIISSGKTQVNFNISQVTLEKVKNLAFWENAPQSDIFCKSVVRFIEAYEKKYGEIKPRPSGNGLDNV